MSLEVTQCISIWKFKSSCMSQYKEIDIIIKGRLFLDSSLLCVFSFNKKKSSKYFLFSKIVLLKVFSISFHFHVFYPLSMCTWYCQFSSKQSNLSCTTYRQYLLIKGQTTHKLLVTEIKRFFFTGDSFSMFLWLRICDTVMVSGL